MTAADLPAECDLIDRDQGQCKLDETVTKGIKDVPTLFDEAVPSALFQSENRRTHRDSPSVELLRLTLRQAIRVAAGAIFRLYRRVERFECRDAVIARCVSAASGLSQTTAMKSPMALTIGVICDACEYAGGGLATRNMSFGQAGYDLKRAMTRQLAALRAEAN